jgi:multidrug resistance efflux pump
MKATFRVTLWNGDSDSFWIDGYFEETALKNISEGQLAKI